MARRAKGNLHPVASKRLNIHIVGIQYDDAFGLALNQSFGSAVRFFASDSTLPLEHADLMIGIFEGVDHYALQTFATRARARAAGVLCVRLVADEALIGPLSIENRAGCASCAFVRMTAANAFGAQPERVLAVEQIAGAAAQILAREALAIISDGIGTSQLLDHVLVVDPVTRDESLHKVIPLAFCSVCGGAAAFPAPAQPPSQLSSEKSVEVVLSELAGWVDQRTGIVSNVFLEPPSELTTGLPIIATATPPHLLEDDGTLRRFPLGWGKGFSVSAALLSAVGEAIERYSASLADPRRIVWERPHDLDGEFLNPDDCALYEVSQYEQETFPYVPFDPAVRHPWILGKWLNNDLPVWVPAVFAFLSLTLHAEQLICQGTSNGLAASTDLDDAARRATLELVERDAFMTAWLTGRPGKRLMLDSTLDPGLRSVVEGMETIGANVEVYILPTSVCGFTVLCLGLGNGEEYPGVTIGLGADMNARSALRQAILELGQTGPYLQRMMQLKVLPIPPDPASVSEMLHHASYYFPLERAIAFDRLRNGDAPVALRVLDDSPRNGSLAECASELQQARIRVALVDVTSPDVANGPFRVMRAVSPDLQPISYGHGLGRKPVERIEAKLADGVPPVHPIW